MRFRRPRPKLIAAAATAFLSTAAIVAVTNNSQAAATGCRVDYAVNAQWPGGFIANVTVTNLGAPVKGWTLSWASPGGQAVRQGWNADITQQGATVSATNAGWNASLDTQAPASFGFVGTRGEAAARLPTRFTLNGIACNGNGGGGTPPQPTAAPTSLPTSGPTSGPTSVPTSTPTSTPTVRPTRTQTAAPTRTTPPVPTSGTVAPTTTSAAPSSGIPAGMGINEHAAPKTVRVFWLKPSDVPYDQRWPDGMAKVIKETQRYYQQELGRTFTLNTQVVEVIEGDHPKAWYENTPQGEDRYWWAVANMEKELHRKLAYQNIDQWVNVGEVSAEGEGGGGGGGNGWVVLNQHDADGAAGVNGDMNRWYGGMVHEMGHALGLPDSTYTDGTPMSASFYGYPNCHFTQAQKQGLLTGHWGSFLS